MPITQSLRWMTAALAAVVTPLLGASAFTCASLDLARASDLSDALTELAFQYGFTLGGAENARDLAARPAAGDVLTRLPEMLRDFDHVIVKDGNGRITKVVVGVRRVPASATQVAADKTVAFRAETAPATSADAGPLSTSPVQGARIASGFGQRRDPIFGKWGDHQGVDLAAPLGTPVRAAAAGRVVDAAWHGGYGNYVRIQHDGMFETVYGHLDRFAYGIAPGAQLASGAVIGYVGATGRVTGAHLHYEILANGTAIDAARLIAPPPADTAVAGKAHRESAHAAASNGFASDFDAALRHALAVAYLTQRLNAVARRLPNAEPDCTVDTCE